MSLCPTYIISITPGQYLILEDVAIIEPALRIRARTIFEKPAIDDHGGVLPSDWAILHLGQVRLADCLGCLMSKSSPSFFARTMRL